MALAVSMHCWAGQTPRVEWHDETDSLGIELQRKAPHSDDEVTIYGDDELYQLIAEALIERHKARPIPAFAAELPSAAVEPATEYRAVIDTALFGFSYAACSDHLSVALARAAGKHVRVVDVTTRAAEYRCHCQRPARWFLTEVVAHVEPVTEATS